MLIPSYEQLAALTVQAVTIERLEAEVAELRRRLGIRAPERSDSAREKLGQWPVGVAGVMS